MVGKDYMLEKPPPPAAWKRFLDLQVLPAAVNTLGAAEAVIEKAAVQGRRRPATALGVAFGAGCGVALVVCRR